MLGSAQFVMVLDSTVMDVSRSQVVADLKTMMPDVQLAITVYTLVVAAFMLSGAKLGDMSSKLGLPAAQSASLEAYYKRIADRGAQASVAFGQRLRARRHLARPLASRRGARRGCWLIYS
jgi:hypothetical protein